MNFDDAIVAHIRWKTRLGFFIDGILTREDIDAANIAADNLCTLGKWIYGEGAQYKGHPEYDDLVKKHATSHLIASEVVNKVESGDMEGARAILNGEFVMRSTEVAVAINSLNLNTRKMGIYQTPRSKGGSTFAHRQTGITTLD